MCSGQELTSQVFERHPLAVYGVELEGFHIVSHGLHAGKRKPATPSYFPGGRIVLAVARRFRCQLRCLRQYLHLRMPHVGGRKAFAEGEQQPGVALQSHLS